MTSHTNEDAISDNTDSLPVTQPLVKIYIEQSGRRPDSSIANCNQSKYFGRDMAQFTAQSVIVTAELGRVTLALARRSSSSPSTLYGGNRRRKSTRLTQGPGDPHTSAPGGLVAVVSVYYRE